MNKKSSSLKMVIRKQIKNIHVISYKYKIS